MLPLWIIDITQDADRCSALQKILGQLECVFLPKQISDESSNDGEPVHINSDSPLDGPYEKVIFQDPALTTQSKRMRVWEQFDVLSDEEELARKKEIEEAKHRKGYQWYYSHIPVSDFDINESDYGLYSQMTSKNEAQKEVEDDKEESDKLSFDTIKASEGTKNLAPKIYKFQEQLVEEGQKFIQMLAASEVTKYPAVNICVIGDTNEDFTNLIFPSVAIMIQKEKGRIMPHHIHQGMSILGMLYIASDTNSQKPFIRERALYTLKEIEVQHRLPTVRGYDRVMIYQDVQNATERFYTKLNKQGQVEYVAQCLIHLYFACNHVHPLLSGNATEESLFFTMGVSAIGYDTTEQDEKDRRMVANELIRFFLDEGEQKKTDKDVLVEEEKITVDNIISKFSSFSIDLSKAQLKKPSPHPNKNVLDRNLKRLYYNQYLRDFPANLINKLVAVTEESLNSTLQDVAAYGKQLYDDFATNTLPLGLDKIVKTANENTGVLTRVIDQFSRLKKTLQQKKDEVSRNMEFLFWNKVIERIPKRMNAHFLRYNEAYKVDLKSKGVSHEQDKIKKGYIDELVNHLKVQPTVVSRISKTVILCVIAMIALIPVLDLLSPTIIDLGRVRKFAVIWDVIICSIVIISQFISFVRYERKTKKIINALRSCFLHDAYARLANRIVSEVNLFYDRAGKLCVKYEERCNKIRLDLESYSLDDFDVEKELPETRFCQPLIGGSFCGQPLLQRSEFEMNELLVNYARISVDDLTKKDYYTLIQTMHDLFILLFGQVYLMPAHRKRFNKEKNAYEFVPRHEDLAWEELRWKYINKNFHKALLPLVKKQFCERQETSIGERFVKAKSRNEICDTLIKLAATNGNITSSSNVEFSDLKVGVVTEESIGSVFESQMPRVGITNYQVITQSEDKDGVLFKSFMFLTRWKPFDNVSYNRIFPLEDFDKEIEKYLVNEGERSKGSYQPSSLILWAMSRDEKSSVWLDLFNSQMFSQAEADCKCFKEYLSKKD